MEQTINLSDYVLIKSTHSPYVNIEMNKQKELLALDIVLPVSGLLRRSEWEDIRTFMDLELSVDNKLHELLISNMTQVNPSFKLTEKNMNEHRSIRRWKALIKKTDKFKNSVHEFDLFIGLNDNGLVDRRSIALLGRPSWELVKEDLTAEVLVRV